MDSMPPATYRSPSPARIEAAANMIALRPEPQTRLMVVAGVVSARPARRSAWRAGAWPDPGPEDLAHDDLVDGHAVREPRALHGGADRRGTQLHRRHAGEGAPELPDRRAGGADDVAPARRSSVIGSPPLERRVDVEPAARLLAQVALRDQPLQDRRRRELRLPEPLVEHAHDAEADVEADEVGQLEGAHRVVEADPGARVDVLRRAQALLAGAHRLGQERHQDAVDDEPGPVRGDDDLLAQLRRERADGRLGGIGRGRAADQLDERHHRHGAEEVHADEAGAPRLPHRGGQAVDRDGRRVGREDGARRRDGVERRPQARLDLDVLEHGLDDEVGVRGGGQVGGRHDAARTASRVIRR